MPTAARSTSRDKVRAHRARMRRKGMRLIQIWVPDVRMSHASGAGAGSGKLRDELDHP